MAIQQDLIQRDAEGVRCHRGGRLLVPAEQAPPGRFLPYRRRSGDGPPPGFAELVRSRGWIADLGQCGLDELVLGLSAISALAEVSGDLPLHYSGPAAGLLRRCAVPVEATEHPWGPHVVRTATRAPVRFRIDPQAHPIWLERVAPDRVQVHAALPMRQYLALEQNLGERLAAEDCPAPRFRSARTAEPWHVVFVAEPGRPEFRAADFAAVARELTRPVPAPWRFTVLTARNAAPVEEFAGLPAAVLREPPAAECVDLFATAELVIGADSGRTLLAALTERTGGGGPQVVALHSRRSPTAWTTGLPHHHAIATPFAQRLARSDRSPEPAAADLTAIPPGLVADFATRCTGRR